MLRPSLTVRLTVAFTLLVALTCGLVSVSLYRSLAAELVWRDNQTLVNRAAQLRQLLLDGAEARTLPLYFNRMMNTRQDILRITRGEEGAIVDINHSGLRLPAMDALPADVAPTVARLHQWQTGKGTDAAALALTGRDAEGPLIITVARIAEERQQVLRQYRQHSLLFCLAAVLLAAAIGPLAIRRSLRAIAQLSQQTAQTDSRGLAAPLPLQGLPAELLPLGSALNQMRQRLAEDFTRLTQFADDLAHELRTPVNVLLAQNQVMLQRPRSPEEYEGLLESNIEELEQMTRLIENILFLSRADHRNIALNLMAVDLQRFTHRVVAFLTPLAEEREIRLEVTASGEVLADELLLQRALTNLLTNAIRHSPEGETVRIDSDRDDNGVTLSVTNCGDPIADADKLFTRFWRADNARHTPGSGLGLAITRAIVQLHGGDIEVEHQQGENRFRVRLPGRAERSKGSG
ncbi:heavy metal sensor histidine kinase [Erwinia sp. Leaf53]|uniref:heavy metal sensor histidine kinase n=1 Tax=Erwinia sp. Leaf53 TaxID=1736225 RepID=UPI0006FB9657|nr:heavy metal sensor histidine kinase [Erwinia sp. Leaf53]KQN55025.1 histidine kinase [Erwinia sp. Leaf53]